MTEPSTGSGAQAERTDSLAGSAADRGMSSGRWTPADVTVVIPTLNAEPHLPLLLQSLLSQQPGPPAEILVVDSMSTDRTCDLVKECPIGRAVPIRNFSHGRARNLGAREAHSPLVVFLSQDATPADADWLRNLISPLDDPAVSAAFSRQVARPDAYPMERHFLLYHYPPGPPLRHSKGTSETTTVDQFFFSNVSAVVRRDVLLAHPFDETIIMSEDLRLSHDLVREGHTVVYQPSSMVLHSHNYTLDLCFRRFFDSSYALLGILGHPRAMPGAMAGAKYVFEELGFVLRTRPWWLPYAVLHNAAKTLGWLFGHVAHRLPRRMARAMSLHRFYWDRKNADRG